MAEEKKLPKEEKPEEEKESGGISRREFLKDAGFVAGGVAAGTTLINLLGCEKVTPEGVTKYVCPYCKEEFDTFDELKAHVAAEHAVAPIAPETIKLTVNGHLYELTLGVEVNEWDTLVYTLRDVLKLTGTKIGCDHGDCGMCTVLINGEAALSCTTLTVECDGKEITTIEGLANPETGVLHPIQQAFIENYGFQCGICTPGMIMTTKALLDENPNPTEEEAREALAGNICRCTGYVKIISSVLAAATLLQKTENKG